MVRDGNWEELKDAAPSSARDQDYSTRAVIPPFAVLCGDVKIVAVRLVPVQLPFARRPVATPIFVLVR